VYYPHNYPPRIRTGFEKKTLKFPTQTFVGHPDDFGFSRIYREQYEILKVILGQVGLELCLLGVHQYKGLKHHASRTDNEMTANLMRFVAIAGDPYAPDFVWSKYDGKVAGGGTNKVYFCGKEMYMTTFMEYDPFMRTMMIFPDKAK